MEKGKVEKQKGGYQKRALLARSKRKGDGKGMREGVTGAKRATTRYTSMKRRR